MTSLYELITSTFMLGLSKSKVLLTYSTKIVFFGCWNLKHFLGGTW